MKYRTLGKTNYLVSEIGYGAWSLGADWGTVTPEQGEKVLKEVLSSGVTFIDTADVYGDGQSEKLIGSWVHSTQSTDLFIATKLGRRLTPHTANSYTKEHMTRFVTRSLKNLRRDCLDLVQLHCPPTEVYYMPEVFESLDELVKQGKVRHYGVSVEKVEEGLKAIEYPGVSTVQIIFNMFRTRPMELFFKEAEKRNVGIIVRVPLASGLLTGKITASRTFEKNDHRQFNRNGEAFDVGETFAGVEFETGLRAVSELAKSVPKGFTMSQFALRWILMQKAVSTVIAGGKTPEQVKENTAASDKPELSTQVMSEVRHIYETYIKDQVHERW